MEKIYLKQLIHKKQTLQTKIVLIATGLGKVSRGFEIYIKELGFLLTDNLPNSEILVLGSGSNLYFLPKYKRIHGIFRNSRLSYFLFPDSSSKRLNFERFTFFLGMLPILIWYRPNVLYLGEYSLYCWLFKFRKLSFFKYRLVLYTGGQAIPGNKLFNPEKDFIHHITNAYLESCRHFPANRQMLLPHFVIENFKVDQDLFQSIQSLASGRKVILSVGAIEKSSKRMHWLVEALSQCNQRVFPVLLGEPTADWDEIEELLKQRFGKKGFLLNTVPRNELGTYYQIADIFVSCSPKESFGLVFVEALLFGLPILCDDFKEVRFVLKEYAHYIKMTGPENVAQAIDEVLSSEVLHNTAMAEKRKEFARSHYSLPVLRQSYTDLFSKIESD